MLIRPLSLFFISSLAVMQGSYTNTTDTGDPDTKSHPEPKPQTASLPSVLSLSPAAGSGSSQVFSAVYSDRAGASYMQTRYFVITSALGSSNQCAVQADSTGIYLSSDDGLSLLGPLATNGKLSNSQCTLIGSSYMTNSGNNSTLTLSLIFTGDFTGTKNVYASVDDTTGNRTGWVQVGTYTIPTAIKGTTIKLACGGDLQSALNAASGPTVITVAHLQADGKTRCQWGSYALPWRSDTAVVTIQTDGKVPAYGTRTQPGDSYLALFMASAADTGYYEVFRTGDGLAATPGHPIHGYKFVGLEMTTPNDNAHISYGLLALFPYTTDWTIQLTVNDFPYSIDVEHCYIHAGNPDQNVARGITFNGKDLHVTDSQISEIHSTFSEANAIWGCDMSGNWTIENNDLEAAAENFFTCGSGPAVPNEPSPNNLTFRYNYVHKPVAWRTYQVAGGGAYIMKNLMELKGWNGALIDSNVFENSWDQSQGGFAVLFTPRVDGDINRTVSNITFQNNTIRHMASGISLGVFDTACPNEGFTLAACLEAGGGAQNFTIKNNLFDDMSGSTWGFGGASYGILTQALNLGPGTRSYSKNLVVDHNTFNAGASPNINSASIFYDFPMPGGCSWNSGVASDVQVTYNIFAFEMVKACETGPNAVLPGSVFKENTIMSSFATQAAWDAAFPGDGILIASTVNPDQRGANLTQLSTLEAKVKAGNRP
jgi:hypothetical protein